MNWKSPVGYETPARLFVGNTLVAIIKKRPSGNLPFYFSQKIIFTYNGGFGSVQAAKRHAEKRLTIFASSILSKHTKNNQ